MRKRIKNINLISDLLKNLKKDMDDYKGQVWFRGQSDTKWTLQPSFNRKKIIFQSLP